MTDQTSTDYTDPPPTDTAPTATVAELLASGRMRLGEPEATVIYPVYLDGEHLGWVWMFPNDQEAHFTSAADLLALGIHDDDLDGYDHLNCGAESALAACVRGAMRRTGDVTRFVAEDEDAA